MRDPLHLQGESTVTFGEARFESLESVGAEQRAQHGSPFVGLGEKKLLKTVLREQDHLQELVGADREDARDLDADVSLADRDHPPVVAVCTGELRGGLRDRHAASALFRPLELRGSVHPVEEIPQCELELDESRVGRFAVIAAQLGRPLVVSRNLVIQRVTDRIKDARLAGTGLAGDEKDAVVVETREVDDLLGFVRAETCHPQSGDLHARPPLVDAGDSINSSASRRDSKAVGPTPLRTYSTNPATISASVCFAVRSL